MSLRLSQLQENKNIKSDRFAMAAISFIYKAFNDISSSKACWPWSGRDDANLVWEPSSGVSQDLIMARSLIILANQRYKEETQNESSNVDDGSFKTSYNKDYKPTTIKEFKRKLNALKGSMKQVNNVSNNLNKKVEDMNEETNDLKNLSI